MRALIQRVSSASVTVDGEMIASIDAGLLILLGVEDADTAEDAAWLSAKIVGLRIFNDEQGVMNFSVADRRGDILVVSQFTLHASTKKGMRPSYMKASRPPHATHMYEAFLASVEAGLGKPPEQGRFGADMQVSLVNDGPVTILIDTKNKE